MSRPRILLALVLAVALAAGATVAFAAEPTSGTVSPSAPELTWQGAAFTLASVDGPDACGADDCDSFALTVDPEDVSGGEVGVSIAWTLPSDDFDLYAYRDGTEVASSAQGGTTSESVTLPAAAATYEIRVVPFTVVDSDYVGTATFAAGSAPPPPDSSGDFAAFLKGVPTDEANSQPGGTASTSTFGPEAPDDPAPVMQNLTQFANRDFAENGFGAFWTGPFSGTLDEALELTWFFSSTDGSALTQVSAEVTVFADPPSGGGVVPPEQIIGRQSIVLDIGPTPTENVSIVPVAGTVAERITIQVALTSAAPNEVRVLYDNSLTPSRFRQIPEPPAAGNVTPEGVDGLPAAVDQGLEFSATVPSDHQRDESEPIVEIDPQGNIYTCGPSGAGTFEFSQVSTDGGDQFHLLGEQPVGAQTLVGGGDCQIALDPNVNAQGNHDYAYVGLGPLTSFAVATSADEGRTLNASPVNGATIPGVDRQWGSYVREDEVLLSYNQQVPRQVVVQKSINSGLAYGPRVVATPTTTGASFPGPMRSLPPAMNPVQTDDTPGVAYFPWNQGANINLSVSFDGGDSWSVCTVAESIGNPTLFVTADHDEAGNIVVVYGENTTFHTFATVLPAGNIQKCDQPINPVADPSAPMPTRNPGFSPPVQVDRGAIRSSIFPWVTAGGTPGAYAVAFYGTEADGNPNSGEFQATWDVYVNQTFDGGLTWSQVKATTHPFHYDSICLEGLNCSVTGGDRSLADFFAIDLNPVNGQLVSVYDQGSKAPDESAGQVATPATIRQVAGPSLSGGMIDDPSRTALRTSSVDPLGDAESSYSALFVNPGPQNQPAADFSGVTVGPEVDFETGAPVEDGGFTVTMELDDLSDEALAQAMAGTAPTPSQSLLWIWRYVDGYRMSAVSARFNPEDGFSFGHNGYVTNSTAECGTPGKCIQYPGDTPVAGEVDQEAGVIRLSVPRSLLTALEGSTSGKSRPAEVPATEGSRIYDGVALSLGNVLSPTQEEQGYLYSLDGTPAFDFLIGDAPASVSIGDVAVPEGDAGNAPASLSVTLSEPVDETVTVGYATADGSATAPADYLAETGTVTFPPQDTTASIAVDVVGDTVQEPAETFTVTLSSPTAGVTLERETGTATILDDDQAGRPETTTVSIGDASAVEGGDLVFTVRLSAPRMTDTTVRASTADGTAMEPGDYDALTETVTIPAGEASETVTVGSNQDVLAEPSEMFTVTLTTPSGGVVVERGTGTGTILDDDPRPGVSVGDATVTEGDSGRTQSDVTLRLSGPAAETVTASYATQDGTASSADDYVAEEGTATFPPGSTEQRVSIRVVGDTDDEPDEQFGVVITDIDGPARVQDGRGDVTILDDDEPDEATEDPSEQESEASEEESPSEAMSPPEETTDPTETPSPGSSPTPRVTPTPRATPTAAPTPGDEDDEVDRVAGSGRIETSVRLSGEAFPDGAPAAVLARADDFPDALAAATLAAEVGGPVLLTGSDRLADGVAAELRRLGVETVYLVGGPVALTPPVQSAVDALGVESIRLAGTDRFVTADAIGREVVRLGGPVDAVIVARADDFPDALSAANLATYGRAPILLTATSELSEQTERALDALLPGGTQTVYLAGGTAATDIAVEQRLVARGHPVERLSGATRFDTAAAILAEARTFDLDLQPALVANGFRFPDALAAGPAAHALAGGLLLVDPEDATRSPATLAVLEADREVVDTVLVVGGEQAIAPRVDGQLADAIADD